MKPVCKIAFLLSVVYFSSCSNQPFAPQKSDSLRSSISMAGKLYFFAPEFDSTNLVAVGECDCCAANTLFLDDSSFIEIDYCDEGSTYSSGKYRADDRSLSLFFDSVYVNSYLADTEDTSKTNSAKTVYRVSIDKTQIRIYQKKEFKGVNIFFNKDIGAPDKESKFSDLLKTIHNEGIWDRLHTNPMTIPRNSPAIEVFLQGDWVLPGDTTAGIKIMEDSIYYFKNRQKLPYRINHDSLRILLAQNELVYPVKIIGTDTLIFEGPEKQVYYRINNYQ